MTPAKPASAAEPTSSASGAARSVARQRMRGDSRSIASQPQRGAHHVEHVALLLHAVEQLRRGTAGEDRHVLAAVGLGLQRHQRLLVEIRVRGIDRGQVLRAARPWLARVRRHARGTVVETCAIGVAERGVGLAVGRH